MGSGYTIKTLCKEPNILVFKTDCALWHIPEEVGNASSLDMWLCKPSIVSGVKVCLVVRKVAHCTVKSPGTHWHGCRFEY